MVYLGYFERFLVYVFELGWDWTGSRSRLGRFVNGSS